MVFGNRDDNSGTGVGFTRDPATGGQGEYGDFLVNAQGEDVVAGIRNTEPLSALKTTFPKVHARAARPSSTGSRRHYRDMCDTEFTIEQGKLWMLQTRVGKRTGRAALKMAVDMVTEPAIRLTRAEAVDRITEDHLAQVLHPQFAGVRPQGARPRASGPRPGAAVGRAYFTADDAGGRGERGEQVVLVRSETSPEDVHGMLAAEGILTARGGLVSHAAVVARGWGKPAVVGAEALRIGGPTASPSATSTVPRASGSRSTARAGPWSPGQVPLIGGATRRPSSTTVLGWADEIRAGHLGVRANADNGDDAANARRLGAEGIGLCRTEHMFLGEDRLPIVRRMILAAEPGGGGARRSRSCAGSSGRTSSRSSRPWTACRSPSACSTRRCTSSSRRPTSSRSRRRRSGSAPRSSRLYEAAQAWQEANPMLGTRGVRLGVIKPGLYAMQVRALMEAARDRVAAGGHPVVEIMIPLTVSPRGAGPGPELGGGSRRRGGRAVARPPRRRSTAERGQGRRRPPARWR